MAQVGTGEVSRPVRRRSPARDGPLPARQAARSYPPSPRGASGPVNRPMQSGGVFVFLSLAPTALALWFLRRHRGPWSMLASACLAFAVVGLVAVLTQVAGQGATTRAPILQLVDLLSVVQMLGSPLWVAGFALFAALAPARDLRRRMLVAVAIEVVIGGFGLVHFLVPPSPL